MARLSNYGSVDDIRQHLRMNKDQYSISKLKKEIEYERKDLNRKSVISLCESIIRSKEKVRKVNRSSVSGRFVKKSFAKKHPKTTVTETVKP